jgi:hypothetical protein
MDNRFKAIVASSGPSEQRVMQIPERVRLARAAAEEFFQLGLPRVNVLLAGRDEAVRLVLRTLLGHFPQPITRWSPGEALVLPPAGQTGTFVLHDVGLMGLREQIQFLEWSTRGMDHMPVVSTTSVPLLPRVASGDFIDTLYYQLATIYLDVTGRADAA